MTQSNNKKNTSTIDVSDYDYDLDDLVVSTTDYSISDYSTDWSGDTVTLNNVSDIQSTGTFTVDTSIFTDSTDVNIDWIYNNMNIDPDRVERMCKEYPALEKVWRNFKSVYDMCKQDYEGREKAGELDDDIPF